MSRENLLKDEWSRRDFMSTMAKTFLGTAFLSALPGRLGAAEAPNAKAKSVIYLFMDGGMSHIDTFDPKPDNKEVQGNTDTVKTAIPGVRLGESLPLIAKSLGQAVLIRSLNSKEGAHERAKYLLHTSYPPLSSVAHPTLGSWVLKYGGKFNDSIPGYCAVGNHPFNSGFFDNEYDPFRVGDPEHALRNVVPPKSVDEETAARRLELLGKIGKSFNEKFGKWEPVKDYANFYDRAVALMRSKDLEGFDLSKESDAMRESYGKNPFGQGVLLARRLVERKVRYVEVTLGGWDTHVENFDKIPDLSAMLDKALAALLEDLAARGLLKETMIVVASEFGRTPRINDAKGRDHHPGVFSCLLAGGGVRGGQVLGSSDGEGREPKDMPVTLQDLNASIAYALGLNPKEETTSPVGRPFLMAGGGKPIEKLFS